MRDISCLYVLPVTVNIIPSLFIPSIPFIIFFNNFFEFFFGLHLCVCVCEYVYGIKMVDLWRSLRINHQAIHFVAELDAFKSVYGDVITKRAWDRMDMNSLLAFIFPRRTYHLFAEQCQYETHIINSFKQELDVCVSEEQIRYDIQMEMLPYQLFNTRMNFVSHVSDEEFKRVEEHTWKICKLPRPSPKPEPPQRQRSEPRAQLIDETKYGVIPQLEPAPSEFINRQENQDNQHNQFEFNGLFSLSSLSSDQKQDPSNVANVPNALNLLNQKHEKDVKQVCDVAVQTDNFNQDVSIQKVNDKARDAKDAKDARDTKQNVINTTTSSASKTIVFTTAAKTGELGQGLGQGLGHDQRIEFVTSSDSSHSSHSSHSLQSFSKRGLPKDIARSGRVMFTTMRTS